MKFGPASVKYHKDHGFVVVVLELATKKRKGAAKFSDKRKAEAYARGWNQLNNRKRK